MSDKAPRILMFAPLCYPPAGSEAIVTAKLVLAMIQEGWEIDVITQGDFGHYYPTKDDDVWGPVKRRLVSIDGIKRGAVLDRLSNLPGFRFLRRIRPLLWALKSTISGFKLLRKKRYDAIFSRVAPQYGHLPALLLSFVTTIPWCAAWSDPMPSQKAPAPYGGGVTAKANKAALAYCGLVANRAEWHVVPCERLRKYFSSYLANFGDKSSTIPHIAWPVTSSNFRPIDRSSFSICFAGSLANRDPFVFLKGVQKFLKQMAIDTPFAIIFVSNTLDQVRNLVTELGLTERVIIHSEKSYQETLDILSISSVLLVIEACCEEGIFFPSKFVDFIQTGRPILSVSPRTGTLSDILSQHGGGIAVDCTSDEDVAEGIARLYAAWSDGNLENLYSSDRLLPFCCDETVLGSYREAINKAAAKVCPT